MQDGANKKGGGDERRVQDRLPVAYNLEVDITGEHVPYTGMIKDISSGGLFITTDEEHFVGDIIDLRFTFPSVSDPVDCQAKVQWVRDKYASGGMAPGVGVSFISLTKEVTAKINSYIRDKEVAFYDEGF